MSEQIAPPRTMGFFGAALLPVNGMIGAGIFALPAVLVAAVGNFAPWMMLLGGILFYGIASILFGLWEGFLVLALAGTLTRLLTYIISAAALPVLEHREGRVVPLHLVIAILAIASSIWVSTHAGIISWQVFGGIFVGGTILYFIARRGDRNPDEQAQTPIS
jgi:hypothetical protein